MNIENEINNMELQKVIEQFMIIVGRKYEGEIENLNAKIAYFKDKHDFIKEGMKETIDQQKKKIAELENTIKELTSDISEKDEEINSLREMNGNAKDLVHKQIDRLDKLNRKIWELGDENNNLKNEVAELREELANANEIIGNYSNKENEQRDFFQMMLASLSEEDTYKFEEGYKKISMIEGGGKLFIEELSKIAIAMVSSVAEN